ncbi:hypothetical protein PTSG_12997 [Salpingoeca rosetta]|uniref:PARP catalytic domain-containing protein n=1 Tax=Salpingoeca rosetta (strain ATCC 50818 / BSB-021) TaxID=946362 RepID=F2UPJ7_SALR5|nr:uncharacterized protein PTSG_12997 [Salpingoeca rosetta]EGD79552.1 hypothetical protein PTSG_12997 [Salpingoeca rosetta]|eukprot:XP_004989033.1 hypothetical protein PTSG_12997 [Salpingoeca rosetta]
MALSRAACSAKIHGVTAPASPVKIVRAFVCAGDWHPRSRRQRAPLPGHVHSLMNMQDSPAHGVVEQLMQDPEVHAVCSALLRRLAQIVDEHLPRKRWCADNLSRHNKPQGERRRAIAMSGGDNRAREEVEALLAQTKVTDWVKNRIRAIANNTCGEIADLGRDGLGDIGARAVAEALKDNTCLKGLALWDNSIGDEGAVALAEMLKHNTTLTGLDLWRNSIGPEGAVALAEMLKHNTALEQLFLMSNRIGPEGAAALAEMLKHNTTLEELYLNNNSMGDEGAVALAEMLKHNTTMTWLDLNNNSIGDKGAVALAEMLKHNTTLEELYLYNNRIGDEGAVALAEMLKHNTALEELYLDNNSITPVGGAALGAALDENRTLSRLDIEKNSTATARAFGAALPVDRVLDTGNWFGDDERNVFNEAREKKQHKQVFAGFKTGTASAVATFFHQDHADAKQQDKQVTSPSTQHASVSQPTPSSPALVSTSSAPQCPPGSAPRLLTTGMFSLKSPASLADVQSQYDELCEVSLKYTQVLCSCLKALPPHEAMWPLDDPRHTTPDVAVLRQAEADHLACLSNPSSIAPHQCWESPSDFFTSLAEGSVFPQAHLTREGKAAALVARCTPGCDDVEFVIASSEDELAPWTAKLLAQFKKTQAAATPANFIAKCKEGDPRGAYRVLEASNFSQEIVHATDTNSKLPQLVYLLLLLGADAKTVNNKGYGVSDIAHRQSWLKVMVALDDAAWMNRLATSRREPEMVKLLASIDKRTCGPEIMRTGLTMHPDPLRVLCQRLHLSGVVTRLILVACDLDDKAAVVLGRHMHQLNHLRVLNLSHNAIGDVGANALSEPFFGQCCIATLGLDGNRITAAGVECLARAMVANELLSTISLVNNPVSEEGVGPMAEAVVVKRRLLADSRKRVKVTFTNDFFPNDGLDHVFTRTEHHEAFNQNLIEACSQGKTRQAEDMLRLGASANAGCNVLSRFSRSLQVARRYVNGTASVFTTALHAAVRTGNSMAVRLLLSHGADANVIDLEGLNPAQVARQLGHREVLDALKGSRDVSAGREPESHHKYEVFMSYRHTGNSKFAYFVHQYMKHTDLHVFMSSQKSPVACLIALQHSIVACPVVSAAALHQMRSLGHTDVCDNVLLQWMAMLELQQLAHQHPDKIHLRRIVPLFVGSGWHDSSHAMSSAEACEYDSFDRMKRLAESLSEAVSAATAAALDTFFSQVLHLPPPQHHKSVREVVLSLFDSVGVMSFYQDQQQHDLAADAVRITEKVHQEVVSAIRDRLSSHRKGASRLMQSSSSVKPTSTTALPATLPSSSSSSSPFDHELTAWLNRHSLLPHVEAALVEHGIDSLRVLLALVQEGDVTKQTLREAGVKLGPAVKLMQEAKELTSEDDSTSSAKAAYQEQLDLLKLLETGSVPLETAKVFVCGDDGIGKSTMIKSLPGSLFRRFTRTIFQPANDPDRRNERTPGIRVCEMKLKDTTSQGNDGDNAASLRVYDFGGQLAYHVIHTLMMSDRFAAFVVCVDLSEPKEHVKERANYWLQFICTRLQQGVAPSSSAAADGDAKDDVKPRVLIVGTKRDLAFRRGRVNVNGQPLWGAGMVADLKNMFGGIVNIQDTLIPLNCHQGGEAGFDVLRSQLAQHWRWLKGREVLVPKVVNGVAEAVKEARMLRAMWRAGDLLDFVRGSGNGINLVSVIQEDTFHQTLRYLHTRGDLLWYSSTPSLADFVFVDPNWLLHDVLGRALTPDGVQQGSITTKGVVTFTDLETAFRGIASADLVINVLQHTLLCFELPPSDDGQRRFMLPSRVEEEVDLTTAWSQGEWLLYAGRRLVVENNALALPPGFFPHVQTLLHKSFGATLKVWKDAFCCKRDGVQCLGLLRDDRAVDVWVRAPGGAECSAWSCMMEIVSFLQEEARGIDHVQHVLSVNHLKQHRDYPASRPITDLEDLALHGLVDFANDDNPPARLRDLLVHNPILTAPWHQPGHEWHHAAWRLDDSFDRQLQWTGPGDHDVYSAPLPSDTDLYRWIESQMGPGLTLSRVEMTKSTTMLRAFKAQVERSAKKRGDPNTTNTVAADPANPVAADATNPFNKDFGAGDPDKQGMLDRLKTQFAETPDGVNYVNVLVAWHGCDEAVADNITATGTANLSSPNDPGFFGAGIYLTPQTSYAAGYSTRLLTGNWRQPNADGEHVMLLCAVSVGLAYPITRRADYPSSGQNKCTKFWGKKLETGCDTHYIQVTKHMGYQSTRAPTPGTFDFEEYVVSQEAQVLPFAKVFVKVDRVVLASQLTTP